MEKIHEENIKSESKNIERPENVAKNLCVRAKRIHFHKYILIIGKSFDHNISNLAIDIWKKQVVRYGKATPQLYLFNDK